MSASRGMSTSVQDETGFWNLRLYAALAGAIRISYRNKIMLIAFIGTHVPLLALVVLYATATATSLAEALRVIGVALVATLIGTGITLTLLHHLLRPILMTAQALRRYATDRRLPSLPVGFPDEAGQLMTDTVGTLTRLDAVLEDLAFVDAVTGLPNRESMLRRLAERLAGGDRLALCVVALRNADQVTAGFGEAGVTIALRVLATRLDAAAGYGAIIARLEGRGFAVVLDASQPELSLVARLEAVLALLRPEISHGEMTLLPDLAVGVALAPEDATEAEALLNAAQAAVPPGFQLAPAFYSAAAQAAVRRRLDLERELRRALAEDGLMLHFQPVVRMTAAEGRGRIVGAEALLRWRHPQEGMIPPRDFIPLAEQCGLMDPIGLWVLRTGCRQLRLWDEAGLPPMRLAVNLSAGQFSDRQLVRSIGDTLAEQMVAAHRLEVEMTETAAMQDRDMTRRVFAELHALGATVAIDDFGTGYSTMSHLRDLHFDILKIDREFVHGVDASRSGLAICKALLALGKGLDIEVLAEGVETAEEVRQLHRHGCGLFQGYHFGKPMAGAAFGAMLREAAMAA